MVPWWVPGEAQGRVPKAQALALVWGLPWKTGLSEPLQSSAWLLLGFTEDHLLSLKEVASLTSLHLPDREECSLQLPRLCGLMHSLPEPQLHPFAAPVLEPTGIVGALGSGSLFLYEELQPRRGSPNRLEERRW